VPDGMKLDAAGYLYCAGPGGIHIFDAGATCLGVIRMSEQTANFCWGGDDLCDLSSSAPRRPYGVYPCRCPAG
jgi:gluconolactonase